MDEEKSYIFQVTDQVAEEAMEKNPGVDLEQINFVLDDGRIFEVIHKSPTVDSFQRYLATCQDKDLKNAGEIGSLQYIKDCIVVPSYDQFYQIIKEEKLPAFTIHFANELAKGMGLTKGSEKKRLSRPKPSAQ